MVSYSNFIQTGVALIFEIAVGYLFSKLKIVNSSVSGPLNKLLFQVGYIPLMFRNLASQDIKKVDFVPLGINGLSSVTCLIFLAVIFLFPIKNKFSTFLATELPALYINYVIIGIPIFNSIWDPSTNGIVGIICLANDVVTSPIYLTLAAIFEICEKNKVNVAMGEPKERFSFSKVIFIIKSIVTAPVFIGIVLGFGWMATGLTQPIFLKRIMDLLANLVLFLSLFCVGCFLSEHSLMSCPWWQFLVCVIVRHILQPVVAGFYSWALNINHTTARQCIIMIALPSAVACYSLSMRTGVGTGCSSTMIFWSTVISIPALVIICSVLDSAKLFPE